MKRTRHNNIADLRVLRIKDGNIILVRSAAVPDEQREKFTEAFTRQVNKQVLLLFVDKLGDIRTLNEKHMNNAGWFRKDNEDD